MTPQEASKILDMFLHKQCDLKRTKFAYSQSEVWCAVKMATEALEKQIPKRINEYNRCPCCDTYNETIEKRKNTVTYDICYCWHCGQALDWRMQNDRYRD